MRVPQGNGMAVRKGSRSENCAPLAQRCCAKSKFVRALRVNVAGGTVNAEVELHGDTGVEELRIPRLTKV